MMRKSKILVLIIATIIILFININSIVSNLLNKKYIVDEINTTNTERGLEGIQKSINLDYTSFRYIILLNSIYLIILVSYILYFNNKNINRK